MLTLRKFLLETSIKTFFFFFKDSYLLSRSLLTYKFTGILHLRRKPFTKERRQVLQSYRESRGLG